jgi:hypothetical protein
MGIPGTTAAERWECAHPCDEFTLEIARVIASNAWGGLRLLPTATTLANVPAHKVAAMHGPIQRSAILLKRWARTLEILGS